MTGFEEFCGGEFWNSSFTWNTEDPDFTECFQNTLLAWLPAAFLLFTTPFEVTSWQSSHCPRIPFTVLNVSKLLVSMGLVAVTVTELVGLDGSNSDAEYAGLGVMLVSYLFSAALLAFSLRYVEIIFFHLMIKYSQT